MALESITLPEIINAPQITPGLGGWDAVINSFMANNAGRQRYGMLSRIANYNGTPDPINLIVIPSGWLCSVSQIFIVPEGSADPGTADLQFGWDSQTSPDNWLPGSGASEVNISDLSVVAGRPQDCLMIHPFAGGTIFPSSYTPSLILPAVPIGNGDRETGADSRYFTMNRTGGSFTGLVHISCFGMIWPKEDS